MKELIVKTQFETKQDMVVFWVGTDGVECKCKSRTLPRDIDWWLNWLRGIHPKYLKHLVKR